MATFLNAIREFWLGHIANSLILVTALYTSLLIAVPLLSVIVFPGKDRTRIFQLARPSLGAAIALISFGNLLSALLKWGDRASILTRSMILGNSFALALCVVLFLFLNYRRRNFIKPPPGNWLLNLANSVCRKSTSDLISQMLADMRVEYHQALNEGRRLGAEWVRLLHYVSIARALSIDRLLAVVFNYVLGTISRR